MKADLNRLMTQRGLDAFIVGGGEHENSVRCYLTNGAHLTGGFVVQACNGEPLLVVNGMEIEEARKSGHHCVTYGDLGYYDLYREHGAQQASILLYGRLLEQVGLHAGRVGLYGVDDINATIQRFQQLNAHYEQYEFVGEGSPTLFDEAYLTKDAAEVERIRSVAERTSAVVAQVWEFISSHRSDASGRVVNAEGQPLTVGAVKRFARRALLDVGLEDTGMIFAPGRDGAFPHSRGDDPTELMVGVPIVFDFFPRELGGGYYHDMTRTWCIGHVPPPVQALYDDVMTAFDIALETYALGKPTHTLQEAVLDFFEAQGHPTPRTTNNPTEGYVHSLGHGIGLNIHEAPSMHHLKREDVFQVGNVVTIEPGLYYPDRAIGIRVEDSFIVAEDGQLLSITPFKKDLLLPLRG
ncbi:MAG: Xaa-Pro peptidase family protein [Anaerolineae bacterium]